MTVRRFAFRFDPAVPVVLAPFRVTGERAVVAFDERVLDVRFGFFRATTSMDNVASATVAGPFRWWKVLGPRMSAADRGATFGTSTAAGVCISFHEPVPALFGPLIRHPGLTVTVADPQGLVAALADVRPSPGGPPPGG